MDEDETKENEIKYEPESYDVIFELSDKVMRKFCYDYWKKKSKPKDALIELADVIDYDTILTNPIGKCKSVYAEIMQGYINWSRVVDNPLISSWPKEEILFKNMSVAYGGYLVNEMREKDA
jgi:hypothetical protein